MGGARKCGGSQDGGRGETGDVEGGLKYVTDRTSKSDVNRRDVCGDVRNF